MSVLPPGRAETAPLQFAATNPWTHWQNYFRPIAPGDTAGHPATTSPNIFAPVPPPPGTGGAPGGPAGPGGFVDIGGGIPSAYASARQTLTDYGLEALLPWFMAQVKGGATPDELLLNMRQTPEFKTEYWEVAARQAKGLAPVSVSDILSYRQTAGQLASQAGLPPGFLDKKTVGQLMVDDVSAAELSNRVVNGIGAVLNADPNVQSYFNQTFGARGPGALAAWFLDPDKAEPLLEQQVREAQIGGSSQDFGFNVDPGAVHAFAAQGITQAQADSGFSQMSKIASLFQTLPSEAGGTAPQGTAPVSGGAQAVNATTGAEALIGKDASALDAVTQRLDARQAAGAGKVGVEEDQTHGFRGLGANI